ncbi:hypothetical protein [Amnibacterium sp.]|uniref:hypothetical protein n=1 Tax=Amnibacterium sp. TaxID=1872496 RepID=UPI00261E621E|nr:hypothetical protein [Amnibacterium sp.]MCU1473427.1 hypothetical protein [Amnibacterium sp.]
MSFNARLRRLVGIEGARGGVVSQSLRNAAQIDVYGTVRRQGPFDVPPPEPVELASPLPWELLDSEPGSVADWVNRVDSGDHGRTSSL